jgi:hypothetical protein
MYYYADMVKPSLPDHFCWSRFGTEAGESIEQILGRKEAERIETGGIFYWGIGSSVGPGLVELIRRQPDPEVLFSPIKSRPRLEDASPRLVVRWRSGKALDGAQVELPEAVCVTSRAAKLDETGLHYALVCASAEPLRFCDQGRLRFSELRNLRNSSRLGASQVTAIVSRVAHGQLGQEAEYVVALRARLVAPYFVRLSDPEPIAVEQARSAA